YDPGGGMRLHALAEALFPAAVAHLAVVFPSDRSKLLAPLPTLVWILAVGLAIAYQMLLSLPGPYSVVHGACETLIGIAGLGPITRLVIAFVAPGPHHRLVGAAFWAAAAGLGMPVLVLTLSGSTGGALPVNVVSATAFIFPLVLGAGLIRSVLSRS